MSRCRTVCRTTLCGFLFLGALAFIAGATHTAIRTARHFETVDRLNQVMDKWFGFDDNSFANVKQTTLVINQVSAPPPTSKRYEIFGNQDGLRTNSFLSLTFNAQTLLETAKDYQYLELNRILPNIANSTSSSAYFEFAPRRSWGVGQIYCECDTRDCECTTPGKECERNEMNAYVGKTTCKRYELCGECRNEEYATKICIAMSLGNEVSVDYGKSGCHYPYSTGNMIEYTRDYKPTFVNVSVVDSKDPIFVAQEITNGSLELQSTQPKDAIIFGLLAALFFIGACYCCRTRKAPQTAGPQEYIVFASPSHYPQAVNYGAAGPIAVTKQQPSLAV